MPHSHDDKTRDRHGNPKHLDAYLHRLMSPERDAWQMPDRVVRALHLQKGQTVAEIGAGPGYFTLRLARAVGRSGTVFAIEVEPKLITILRDRLEQQHISNVTPVLALGKDPLLPPMACDLIVAINAFHHVVPLAPYLRRLKRSLKPGGHLIDIDFHDRETPVGPPVEHRLASKDFVRAARHAGLEQIGEASFLPYQYFLSFGRPEPEV